MSVLIRARFWDSLGQFAPKPLSRRDQKTPSHTISKKRLNSENGLNKKNSTTSIYKKHLSNTVLKQYHFTEGVGSGVIWKASFQLRKATHEFAHFSRCR